METRNYITRHQSRSRKKLNTRIITAWKYLTKREKTKKGDKIRGLLYFAVYNTVRPGYIILSGLAIIPEIAGCIELDDDTEFADDCYWNTL